MRCAHHLLAAVLAAGCTSEGLTLDTPDAGAQRDAGGEPAPIVVELVDPEDLGFGEVERGAVAELEVVLSPAPEARVMELDRCDAFCAERVEVPADTEGRMHVRFTPRRGERYEGRLIVRGADTRELTIRGDGVDSAVRCSPALPSIGRVALGACGVATVTCRNTGLGTTGFAVVRYDLENARSDAPSNVAQTLRPFEARSFELELCPETAGAFSASIAMQGALPAVHVEGTGEGARVAASPFDAGRLPIGLPRLLEVPLLNAGLLPLVISRVEVAASEVALVSRPAEIAPGRTEHVVLRVTPAGAGSAALILESNDERGTRVEVPLTWDAVARPCSLVLHTSTVDFGARVLTAAETATEHLVLEHSGAEPCALTLPRALSAPFAHAPPAHDALDDGESLHLELAPGRAFAWPIRLDATAAGPVSASLTVRHANDSVAVPLRADVLREGLVVEVDRPGCVDPAVTSLAAGVSLAPAASTSIVVTRLAFTPFSAAFAPPVWPPLPAEAPLGLTFVLDDLTAGAHFGRLEIDHLVGGEQRTTHVSVGAMSSFEEQVDAFELLRPPSVDFVWVFDGSGSMAEDTTIGPNVSAHVQFLYAQGLDARIAVAAIDGPAQPIVVDAPGASLVLDTSAMAQEDLERRLLARLAAARGGHQLEQPFAAAHGAIDRLRAAELLRPTAYLSVLVITDEDDQSAGTVDEAVHQLLAVKGLRNTNLLATSVISGGREGCASDHSRAAPAPRLIEAATRLGGVAQELCTADWSRALEDLSTTAFGSRLRFLLTNQPIVSTLRVFFDGVETPDRGPGGTVYWTYDYATNSINLSPFATTLGNEITVRYYAACL